METADRFLDLLTEHWQVLTGILSFLGGGGYLLARYRTSGMRKMIAAHNDVLDELQNSLVEVRQDLNASRAEYSEALKKAYQAEAEVERLRIRVLELEMREQELLSQINRAQ